MIYHSNQNLDTQNDNGIYTCQAVNGAPAVRANTTELFRLIVWCEYFKLSQLMAYEIDRYPLFADADTDSYPHAIR